MKTFVMFVFVLLFSATCYGQVPLDRYRADQMRGGYQRFGSNPAARWVTDPPKIYSGGKYLGELSENPYRMDSISNPYGRYGSRYSSDSIRNPYGRYGIYSASPIYVYP